MEMDDFTQLVQSVNGLLWGMYCLIPLLVGTGIYLTIKLRFIQIRRFGQAWYDELCLTAREYAQQIARR